MDEKKIIESLSVNEIKVLPHIKEKDIEEICRKSGMERVSVLRALEYLEKKNFVKLSHEERSIVEVGVNGALYRKKGLPERRLLNALREKRVLSFEETQKKASLSNEELKISIGVLKKRDLIDLKNKKIILKTKKTGEKFPEETILELLPVDYNLLSEENQEILKFLDKRKDIVRIKKEKTILVNVTSLGEKFVDIKIKGDLIEQITPEMLKKDSWKTKKFRRYDLTSNIPDIYGGKRHFVNQASDYARRVWMDMGFKEMNGNLIQTSFWNFDALFTAQDHPVREMQDTFFLSKKIQKGELPDKKIVKNVRDAHEGKSSLSSLKSSKGWKYNWNSEDSKKLVLRTHTTVLSAQTLANIDVKELPAKFFALGKCFRNETVDWSHGFEFNQTEGIVIDKNANFRHLLGYLKQFFKKMGFDKIRFRPAYFPYTEPSVEVDVFHEGRKEWLELGGAGIFRPEVVVPILGEDIPVLAWGPGFDRILMNYYKIKDIRELYKNDISQLRKIKFWMKT